MNFQIQHIGSEDKMEGKFHVHKKQMSPSRSDLQLELGVHPNDWHGGFKGGAADWSSQR